MKSTVQKPVAIKYKSRNCKSTEKRKSPLRKPAQQTEQTSPLRSPVAKKSPTLGKLRNKDSFTKRKDLVVKETTRVNNTKPEMNNKSITPIRGASGKRTLTCYICGREFGTASLHLHEPKCLEKWERENASLPHNLRRKPPVKPDSALSQKEFNQLAWESSQATLVPCKNCGRTFYPDRLAVHQRSCKVRSTNGKKCSSNDTVSSQSSSSMSQSPDPPSSSSSGKRGQPPSVECYICGRKFGTHSIKIHERQCLKKWHTENESLPRDMRSPAPVRQAKDQALPLQSPSERSSTTSSSNLKSSKDERPTSGAKSPLFPCYLCGRLFTVNSIYIHEPQCLKMWKIENDKLPPSKRRPVPLKPDVKFTRSGKINFEETTESYWQSHLNQLVPCKMCSRTFNPDRVAVHEKSCKGN